MKSNVQEDKEDDAMFLSGGSAEHRDHHLVCSVYLSHCLVLVIGLLR